jgi:hypothetical protein
MAVTCITGIYFVAFSKFLHPSSAYKLLLIYYTSLSLTNQLQTPLLLLLLMICCMLTFPLLLLQPTHPITSHLLLLLLLMMMIMMCSLLTLLLLLLLWARLHITAPPLPLLLLVRAACMPC